MLSFLKRRSFYVALLFVSVSVMTAVPAKVFAAETGQWISVSKISKGGDTYVDPGPYDDTVEFRFHTDGCDDKINGFHNDGDLVNDNGDVDDKTNESPVDFVNANKTQGGCKDSAAVPLELTNKY